MEQNAFSFIATSSKHILPAGSAKTSEYVHLKSISSDKKLFSNDYQNILRSETWQNILTIIYDKVAQMCLTS